MEVSPGAIDRLEDSIITTDTRNIYHRMADIMKDITPVGMGGKNVIQRYDYRKFYDVADMLQPIMAKHQVFITSEVLEREQVERTTSNDKQIFYTTIKVKYTFHAPDGSNLSSVSLGEGMDTGDKSTNKAMTAAFKYALGQAFLIPYQMADSEEESPTVKSKYPARKIKDSDSRQRQLETNHKIIDECHLDALKISQHLIKKYGVSRQYDLTDEQLSHFSEQLRLWRSSVNGSNARKDDDHFAQHEAG